MRKREEIENQDSCLNRALDTEMLFVLIGRDICAPATIRFWCEERIKQGRNSPGDQQLIEAEACAQTIEASTPMTPDHETDTLEGLIARWFEIAARPIKPAHERPGREVYKKCADELAPILAGLRKLAREWESNGEVCSGDACVC